ncbi:helix-turn-helix domain-containing protein [Amycolatopsis samaneae]|uniref:Helix-turn-helix domain-containing protein n=1 Tax=Amycolatopsis samaneae TaxID=664691 RepID=A0ABW5GQ77_9PSEU
MFFPEENARDRTQLAGALRRLRRQAGLSGERLAKRANMSQSKISRIETGKLLPTTIDVERLIWALRVSPDTANEITALARTATTEFRTKRRTRQWGIRNRQRELADLEQRAREIRHVLPVIPTGLLQTPAYLDHTGGGPTGSVPPEERAARTANRLARQQTLDDPDKHFTFVLTEAAVRHRLLDDRELAGQARHLAELDEMATVSIQVIPLRRRVRWLPLNVFVIYDDKLVTIETDAGLIVLRDPRDIQHHLELFTQFSASAFHGEDCRALLLGIAAGFDAECGG